MKFSVKKFAVDALKYGKLLNISEITIYILNSVNKIYSEIYQSAEILGFFKEICLLILVAKKRRTQMRSSYIYYYYENFNS